MRMTMTRSLPKFTLTTHITVSGAWTARFAVLLIMASTIACTSTRHERDPLFEPLRAKLQRAVAEEKVASISVAVAIDGQFVWQEAFGLADRERGIPATPETRYPIASVTKPMTATGVMLLGDRGLVDLSRPANDYLGDGKIRGGAADPAQATVRLILLHRAGLAEHNEFYYANEGRPRPPIEEAIHRYALVAWPAGQRYRYSNLGYGVLEAIIAQASGRPFEQFLRDEVFLPLGMTRTTVGYDTLETAVTYDSGRQPIPRFELSSLGSGSVVSTPHDMVRFGLHHVGAPLPDQRPILRGSTRQQMLGDHVSTGSTTGRYGLDWYCGLGICGREASDFGYAWYGHDGGFPGSTARLKIVPSRRAVVAAVSNTRSDLTLNIVDEILDVLLPEFAEKRKQDPALAQTPSTPTPLPASFSGTWRGTLASADRAVEVSLTIDGQDGRIQIGDDAEKPLKDLTFDGTALRARARATVPFANIPSHDYEMSLNLELRGETFSGAAYAAVSPPLFHFFLPFWFRATRH
jgi:CubicO group peptidase (beta-lactamase class C family)